MLRDQFDIWALLEVKVIHLESRILKSWTHMEIYIMDAQPTAVVDSGLHYICTCKQAALKLISRTYLLQIYIT